MQRLSKRYKAIIVTHVKLQSIPRLLGTIAHSVCQWTWMLQGALDLPSTLKAFP